MLVNKDKGNTSRVKFISYDGDYPCLCSGVLVLEIDGKQYKFGHHYLKYHYDKEGKSYYEDEDSNNPNFNTFWASGGCITGNGEGDYDISTAEWEINIEELPEQFRELAAEIDAVFNENVDYGCCGGCI